MEYRELGRTGVFVSQICLGTMTFGGEAGSLIGGLTQSEADAFLGKTLDAGVNFIDTANVYSYGESEELLGRVLGKRRNDVVLATKVYGRMGVGPNEVGLTRLNIMQQVEGSLRRLRTDYIDLYQSHAFDLTTPVEETLRAFDDLVRQGKVRYIGCSNHNAWHVVKALGVSALHGFERYVSVQAYYSIAGRELEREIVPMLKDQNLSLLVWSPLAGGFLSGKYTRHATPEEHSRRKNRDFPPVDLDRAYDVIDAMSEIARSRSVSVAQIALAWLLHQAHVTSIIIGARKPEQLEGNLKCMTVKLSAEELEALDAVSRLKLEYPAWTKIFSQRLPHEGLKPFLDRKA